MLNLMLVLVLLVVVVVLLGLLGLLQCLLVCGTVHKVCCAASIVAVLDARHVHMASRSWYAVCIRVTQGTEVIEAMNSIAMHRLLEVLLLLSLLLHIRCA